MFIANLLRGILYTANQNRKWKLANQFDSFRHRLDIQNFSHSSTCNIITLSKNVEKAISESFRLYFYTCLTLKNCCAVQTSASFRHQTCGEANSTSFRQSHLLDIQKVSSRTTFDIISSSNSVERDILSSFRHLLETKKCRTKLRHQKMPSRLYCHHFDTCSTFNNCRRVRLLLSFLHQKMLSKHFRNLLYIQTCRTVRPSTSNNVKQAISTSLWDLLGIQREEVGGRT